MKNLLFTPPGCISLEHASLATAAINRERRKDDRDVPQCYYVCRLAIVRDQMHGRARAPGGSENPKSGRQ